MTLNFKLYLDHPYLGSLGRHRQNILQILFDLNAGGTGGSAVEAHRSFNLGGQHLVNCHLGIIEEVMQG